MASLYFADQKAQKSAKDEPSTPGRSESTPGRSESVASSAVGEMSYLGNDGIQQKTTPLPPPVEKTDEISGDVVLDAEVEPMPAGYGGRTVASDITENTGRGGPNETANAALGSSAAYGSSTAAETRSPENGEEQAIDDDDKKSSGGDNRMLMIILCVVCCIIVAGGAGAGVGIALSKGDDPPPPPPPPATPAPVATTAPKPPTPNKETPAPVAPVTPAPTPAPVTDAPVESPVDPDPVPFNDQCSDATGISTVASSFGSTDFATSHPELTSICGIESNSAGVWYSVVGNGGLLDASTCGDSDFDTKLSVFAGPCSSLQCIVDNDDDPDNEQCGLFSTATWLSEAGVVYYIFVHGFGGGTGNFELTVRGRALENDDCEGAITVVPDGSFTTGSTGPASVDFAGICDVEITAPGVWYRFTGTGETLAVHTCSGTNYDTMLTVFQGNCGGLACVAGNDDFVGCGLQSRVMVDSEVGQSYYVLVHGYSDNTGDFALSVGPEDNLYPDKCIDSQSVSPGDYIVGNNEFASFDFDEPFRCDLSVVISGPTVWYDVLGTGGTFTVSLCDAQTNFDTQISVFGGSCFEGFCQGGNDDSADTACGRTSEYSWQSIPFQNYLIAIHGFGNETGTFGMLIDDLGDGPTFSSCLEAGGPAPQGGAVQLSLTDSATIDQSYLACGAFSGTTVSTSGVWLRVEGDGGTMTTSVCDNNPPGTSLYVFSGSCNALTCVQPTVGGCSLEWETEFDVTYYMFIEGPSAGSYEFFSVSSAGDPDICAGAIPLEVNGPVVVGSTFGAGIDDDVSDGVCGESITAPGVWYRVVGEGDVMAVSLCQDETFYDTKVSVFSGDCDNLVCIGGNDDFQDCNLSSAFSWFPVAGENYFILVHGYDDDFGQFGIQVLAQ